MHHHHLDRKALRRALTALGATLLIASLWLSHALGQWWLPAPDRIGKAVTERGTLRVASLRAPTVWFEGASGPSGYEYELALSFARSLGVDIAMIEAATPGEVIALVETGAADIGAAGLTITPDRQKRVLFSQRIAAVDEQILCPRNLQGGPIGEDAVPQVPIKVVADSAHVEALDDAQRAGWQFQIEPVDVAHWSELYDRMALGEAFCSVIDSHLYALYRRYEPSLQVLATLPGSAPLGWALAGGRRGVGHAWQRRVNDWLMLPETQRLLVDLEERYFGFAPDAVSLSHILTFRSAVDLRLPAYRALFEREAERVGIPWTLLAAVAYQESRWIPNARSPTGVRGMMMLTRPTARELGVTNRVDAAQSVRGGATHLRRLYDRVPDDITGPERWWFALAAYNLGFSHLEEVRAWAESEALDADHWPTVRTLLQDADVYDAIDRRAARGREAAIYVRRIRDYADILEKTFAPDVPLDG